MADTYLRISASLIVIVSTMYKYDMYITDYKNALYYTVDLTCYNDG